MCTTKMKNDELLISRFKEERQIASSGNSRIKRVLDLFFIPTVRVEALEYSWLNKKGYSSLVCKFGGFEYILRDVGVRASVYYRVYRRYDDDSLQLH